MPVKKKRIIYICIWALLLVILMISTISAADTEDDNDYILALMIFAIPCGIMMLDMFHFAYYDRYYTPSKFVTVNFIIVFVAAYFTECAVVLLGFGMKNPQYRLLYTFAPGGALAAAVLNLFQTVPYKYISKKGNATKGKK